MKNRYYVVKKIYVVRNKWKGTTFKTRFPIFLFSKYGYKSIDSAVEIVNGWQKQGYEIYLCSYVRKRRYNFIKRIIDFYGMKYNEILCREKGEQYIL